MLDIGQSIDCLYRFSMDLRKGNPTNRYAKSSSIDTSFYEPYDIEYVRQKFPSAEEFLVNRLGKSISKRRQYLRYRELHAAKLSQNPIERDTSAGDPELQEFNIPDTGTILSETTATTFEDGAASDFDPNYALESDFNPSGIRRRISMSSVATETTYATSAGNEGRARMPSMPEDALAGRPFECPYCHNIDSVSNTHAWMKHVYRDLQPYVCTFEGCVSSEETYESRHRWFSHELQQHRQCWTCSSHCSREFRSREEFKQHIRRYRPGGVSTAQIPLYVDSAAVALDQVDAESICPLCNIELQGTAQIEKHLGRHLEEIALFALPQNDSDSENDVSFDSEDDSESEVVDQSRSKDYKEVPLSTEDTMVDQGRPGQMIFCHTCQNEWFEDEHGLECPVCNSNNVVVVSRSKASYLIGKAFAAASLS